MERGYVQIYTGNGKGKTTAALGLVARAVGNNFKVFFCQFMKGTDYGEIKTLASFPNVKHERYGRGVFIRKKELVTEEDINLMRRGYESLKNAIVSEEYDIVVADEIFVALKFELVSLDEIKFLIKNKSEKTELILTGRNAPDEIVELADLVTEMKEIKHYFKQGVFARKGIEK